MPNLGFICRIMAFIEYAATMLPTVFQAFGIVSWSEEEEEVEEEGQGVACACTREGREDGLSTHRGKEQEKQQEKPKHG